MSYSIVKRIQVNKENSTREMQIQHLNAMNSDLRIGHRAERKSALCR